MERTLTGRMAPQGSLRDDFSLAPLTVPDHHHSLDSHGDASVDETPDEIDSMEVFGTSAETSAWFVCVINAGFAQNTFGTSTTLSTL